MKYEGVSDELLERIARDVRAWDKSRTPEVGSQKALESLASDINDYMQTLKRDAAEAADARRRTVEANEIQAVAAVLALSPEAQVQLSNSGLVHHLMDSYLGIMAWQPSEGS